MRKTSFLVLLVMTALASPAAAGRFNKVLSIGDTAPAFKDIVGTDDKPHGLDEYKDAKVVVAVFTCNHCPVAQQYEQRLIDLQRDYHERGVQVVAICVNAGEEDNLAHMKDRVKASSYNFPYLSDPSQGVGRLYGAEDARGVCPGCQAQDRVHGRDRRQLDGRRCRQEALPAQAIDAALQGARAEVTEARATGCGIDYNP